MPKIILERKRETERERERDGERQREIGGKIKFG